jgi:hypothetical protein
VAFVAPLSPAKVPETINALRIKDRTTMVHQPFAGLKLLRVYCGDARKV